MFSSEAIMNHESIVNAVAFNYIIMDWMIVCMNGQTNS